MKKILTYFILLTLTSCTSKACLKCSDLSMILDTRTASISDDSEIKHDIENPNSNEVVEAYPLKDITQTQEFVKYYLFSKHDLFASRGLTKLAESNYKISQLNPENVDFQERAFLLTLANNDPKKATKILENKTDSSIFDVQEEFNLALQLKNNNYKKAQETLNSLMSSKNRLPHLKVLKAYFKYKKHKNIKELEKEILNIKTSLTLDGFKYYYIAREYENQKNYKKALEFYTVSIFKFGLKTPEIFSRWIYTLKQIDKEKAEKVLTKGQKFGKDIFIVDKTLIETNKIKRIDNSIQAMTAQIFFDLGWSISETSTNVIGLDFLVLSEILTPKNKNKARYQYAKALLSNKWQHEAIKSLKSINYDSKYYVASRLLLTEIYSSKKDSKKAIKTLEELKKSRLLKTDYVDSLLGQVYLNAKEFKKAEASFKNAIKNFKTAKIFFAKAIANERLGKYEEAIKDLKSALKLSPKNPLVLNYLGYLLIDLNKDVEKGLSMIKKSIEIDPTNAASLDSLGWAYIKLKKYEEGLSELEKAYEIDNSDPVITGHLGDAYLYNNRKREAILYWKKALSLEGDDERELNRIKKQLEKHSK